MEEKRRHKRIVVKGVYGKMFITFLNVEILNLSLGGVAIQLNKGLTVGREYTMEIDNKGKRLELKGNVAWSVLKGSRKDAHNNTEPIYHAGIKFGDILSSKASSLIDFMEANKNTVSKVRLRGIRVKVDAQKNAVLYDPCGYKVKLISPFGMLIETTQPMAPEDRFPMEIFLKDVSPFRVDLMGRPEGGLPEKVLLEKGASIKFLGRIVSCTELKEADTRRYDIGVEFLEMHAEDWVRLEEFIRSV